MYATGSSVKCMQLSHVPAKMTRSMLMTHVLQPGQARARSGHGHDMQALSKMYV